MIFQVFASPVFFHNTKFSIQKKKGVSFCDAVNVRLIPVKEELEKSDLWWTGAEICEMNKMKAIAYEQFKKDYFTLMDDAEDPRSTRAKFYDLNLPDSVLGDSISTPQESSVSLARWFLDFFE